MILKGEAGSSILHEGTFYKFDAQGEVNIAGEEVIEEVELEEVELEEVELEEIIENIAGEEVIEEVVEKKVKSKK